MVLTRTYGADRMEKIAQCGSFVRFTKYY